MADITIEGSAYTTLFNIAARGGPFWTSPTVGYVVYCDSAIDLKYRKTSDGGATWAAAVNIRTGTIIYYDSWADWQTAGDVGTKIHIAYIDADSDDIRYVYLDTSDDSVGGDNQIEACQGDGALYTTYLGWRYQHISITKTRGGNLAVALRHRDNSWAVFYSFYTSPDATIWTSKASPWEASIDFILLFPGNEADNQDVWGTFWDVTTSEISLKTYDNSGNSWSEQSISGSMTEDIFGLQMDGAIRLSDGHLIFAAWNLLGMGAAADLMVWDINGAASITAKANVITNTAEYATVSVFINQVNDDIYIAYVGGTDFTSLVAALYKKSVDGGANWGGQTALQADAEDDERWISAGAIKAAWGGKFQPFWHNDDLDDLFTNSDNGISIAAAEAAITLELRSSSSTRAAIALNTGISTRLRSSTDTAVRLTISVAISIAGRAYSNTRAALTISVTAVTELALRSFTDTRAGIAFDTLVALAFKSLSDTRASLALDTLIDLALRSQTDTRATLALISSIVLTLRSFTDTRAALSPDVIIELSLLSLTDTRAALALTSEVALTLRSLTDTRASITISVTAAIELELKSTTDTRAAVSLATRISVVLRTLTDTRADLVIAVAPLLACRSFTDTRASAVLETMIGLALRAASDTRADLVLVSQIALAARSLSDTRAALALAVITALQLRSLTESRAALELTIAAPIELALRSLTATRAAIALTSLVILALASQTTTRAALAVTLGITKMTYYTLNMSLPGRELTLALPGRDLTMAIPSRTFDMKVRQNG